VQALVGRIEDRRIVTYGENPQADVRSSMSTWRAGAVALHVRVIRDRADGGGTPIDGLSLPCPASTTRRTPRRRSRSRRARRADAAIRGARRLRRRQAALHHHRRVERRRIIDDYGHHPVEIAAVLKAARAVAEGQVIAVCSRTATPGCAILFDRSAPASTTPTR
jgi:UDP-N-acetylmuramate--alanine ligase